MTLYSSMEFYQWFTQYWKVIGIFTLMNLLLMMLSLQMQPSSAASGATITNYYTPCRNGASGNVTTFHSINQTGSGQLDPARRSYDFRCGTSIGNTTDYDIFAPIGGTVHSVIGNLGTQSYILIDDPINIACLHIRHIGNIAVTSGQVILAGTYLGRSNGAGGHVHINALDTTCANRGGITVGSNERPIAWIEIGYVLPSGLTVNPWQGVAFQSQNPMGISPEILPEYNPRRWVYDITGDNTDDIIEIDDAGNIHTYINSGTGCFLTDISSPSLFKINDGWFDITYRPTVWPANVNNDTYTDIIGIRFDGNILVSLSNGDGTFSPTYDTGITTYGLGQGWFNRDINPRVWVADVNGDGNDDIIGINNVGRINVALANGNGSYQYIFGGVNAFSPEENWFDTDYHPTVWPADVNGDGNSDIIGIDYSGTPIVVLANGDGTFSEPNDTGIDAFGWAQGWFNRDINPRVWVADVNGDGNDDIVGINNVGATNVALADGLGGFQAIVSNVVTFNPQQNWFDRDYHLVVWPADVDDDGDSDILGVNYNGVPVISIANGDGTFNTAYSAGVSSYGWGQDWFNREINPRVWVSDVNNDGDDDLIGIGNLGDVVITPSDGNGRFRNPLISGSTGNPPANGCDPSDNTSNITGLSVIGDLDTFPIIPNFQWNRNQNYTWYQFYLSNTSGIVLDQWYQDGSGVTCTTVCTISPNLDLGNGEYTWWVRGWNNNGYGSWSDEATFTVNMPLPTQPTDLVTSGEMVQPTFEWTHDANTTWYQLQMNSSSGIVHQAWYEVGNGITCNTTCSITPELSLSNGDYTWWVQGWSSVGTSAWSEGETHTVNYPVPAQPTNLSATVNGGNPTLAWTHDVNTAWYFVQINNPNGMAHSQWYEVGTDVSCGATCTLVTGLSLSNDEYTWWVQGWNSVGTGLWSDGDNFTVFIPPASQPTGLTTNGSPTQPTYGWVHDGASTWYELYVSNANGIVHNQWYEVGSGINCTETCSITPPVTLLSGSHSVWVRGWNATGNGLWSDEFIFAVP